jgi:Uma2 family endonuclease
MAVSEQEIKRMYGEVVATGVSLEDYMAHYAADHHEWVEGTVIKMSPSNLKHVKLIYYLYMLFDIFFEHRPIGQVIGQPFVQRLPAVPERRREPDLLIILNANPHELKDTYMDGPADIVIEIVSEESIERDHGEKFAEYEKGGVPEYWIVDPLRSEPRFYRLDENGIYRRFTEDAEGNYQTPVLPGLKVHVPTLWLDKLPGASVTFSAVQKMLEETP